MNPFTRTLFVGLTAVIGAMSCLSEIGDVCPAYACINRARLTGSVQLSTAELVDVRWCQDETCREALVDLSSLQDDRACAEWTADTAVCLSPTARSGDFTVEAMWGPGDPMPEGPHELSLTVIDHTAGTTLVSEKRRIEYAVTQEDSCHRCFGTRVEL